MRRGGPTQQRVWLGPGQYRGGCRDAASNPNSHSDSCVISNAVRGWNTNTYAYAYSDGNGYGNSNSDGYGNCNAYSERNTDSDTHGNGDHFAYSYTKGDTKGSPDTASAADSVVGLGASLECCSRGR